jgi:hypothetical protein
MESFSSSDNSLRILWTPETSVNSVEWRGPTPEATANNTASATAPGPTKTTENALDRPDQSERLCTRPDSAPRHSIRSLGLWAATEALYVPFLVPSGTR